MALHDHTHDSTVSSDICASSLAVPAPKKANTCVLHLPKYITLHCPNLPQLRAVSLLPGCVRLRFDSGHRNNVFQARMLPHTSGSHIITCAADGQVRQAVTVTFFSVR
jgi:hypothetical protein